MKVYGDEMVAASCDKHVRDQFSGDWSSALVLFVLTSIWIAGNNSGDAAGGGGATCRDKDEELHHVVVDIETAGLDDENILITDGLRNFDVDFSIGEALDISRDKGLVQPGTGTCISIIFAARGAAPKLTALRWRSQVLCGYFLENRQALT